MCNEKHGNGNFWIGFFLGGLVGAFIVYLLGTKEGKKVAERFLEQAELYEEELEEKVASIQKKGEELLSEVKTVREKVVRRVEEGKSAATETLVTKMDQALSKIEDIQKQGVALTEEVHHHYFRKNGKSLAS